MARTEKNIGERELSVVFQEITPPHGWKQDPDYHYLRLTLPGFEANDITIHMDKYGHLVVRGNKQVTERKYLSFEETFAVPKDAKLEDASGMFEDGQIYCVAIPKVKGQQHAITITIPKDRSNPKPGNKKKGASIHRYGNNNDNDEGASTSHRGSPKDYLRNITGETSNKKIAYFIAFLLALVIIMVVLIVKLRRS